MNIKLTRDFISGLILFVLGVVLYFYVIPIQVQESPGMPTAMSPRLFCKVSAIALILLSVILMAVGLIFSKSQEATYSPKEIADQRLRGLVSICMSILYIVLINTIGYFVSTSMVLLFFTLYFGGRNWKVILLSQAIVLPFIYLLFVKGLNVVMPGGLLF